MTDTGWHDALEALYEGESTRLVSLAEWIVGNRSLAEELLNDTFAALLERPVTLHDDDALSAYVRSALLNRSRSKVRRLILERRHAQASADRSTSSHLDRYHDPDDEVRLAVAALPRRQREVVALRFHDDLDVLTIASTLGISEGSVKTHLHRASKALTETLRTSQVPAPPSPRTDPA